jgi:hypothetical protein
VLKVLLVVVLEQSQKEKEKVEVNSELHIEPSYYKIIYFCLVLYEKVKSIMEFGSFLKNLAYNVKNLSGFSKTVVKLTPTNTTVDDGGTFKVRLPQNTLVDLRSLCMFYEGTSTTSVTTGGFLLFPRLSSSIIDTLNLYVNGTLIENIQEYGHLYSTLYDLSAAVDQTLKRFLENSDPSIYVDNTVANRRNPGEPIK